MNYKKIGVVIADMDEYKPFKASLEKLAPKEYRYFSKSGLLLNIGKTEVICLYSGIGKVNAAAAAMHLCDIGCEAVLNFGLSGGISDVSRGEFILPAAFLEHDFDLSVIGYKPCEKPGQKYIYYADKELSLAIHKSTGARLAKTAVCGDRFICSNADRQHLSNSFNADSCDMETAAIASVCDMTETPFVSLRRISDDAGDSAVDTHRDMLENDNLTLGDVFIKGLTDICE